MMLRKVCRATGYLYIMRTDHICFGKKEFNYDFEKMLKSNCG